MSVYEQILPDSKRPLLPTSDLGTGISRRERSPYLIQEPFRCDGPSHSSDAAGAEANRNDGQGDGRNRMPLYERAG